MLKNEPTIDYLVAHYDEITLKRGNKSFFVGRLLDNVRQILGKGFEIESGANKLVIKLIDKKFDEVASRLKKVPGIANLAPAVKAEPDMDSINRAALFIFKKYQPATFKMETSRTNKQFALTSPEISRQAGGYILSKFEVNQNIKVDVKNPELVIKIELEKSSALILGKKEQGMGGLPVGTAGKAICLLSGGIDSPVAAFQMMRRGVKVHFVHFHNQTINKQNVKNKIRNLVKILAEIQGEAKLYIVPFAELQKRVIAGTPAEQRMIIYKRLMFKLAQIIAKRLKADALISGDSLSQVASQTMDNLKVIYQAVDMLHFAPLIGQNKIQIMNEARLIGTYQASSEPYEDCCSLLIAKHPETHAKLPQILQIEQALDLDELIDETARAAEAEVIKPDFKIDK